ncbi:MAG: hypothetical protein IKT41_05400 [Clostridia bacterium]|nr:hypothetical protein [Clostridia bacterium]
MLLWVIVIGSILRWYKPGLLYICGAIFLAILFITACASIKEKEYGWKEGLITSLYAITVLVLMFG